MKMVELEQVCDIRNGYAFKSEEYRNTGAPLLRISNFNDGDVFIDENTAFIDPKYLSTKSDFIVEHGDILIALSGATTGKYGFYNFNFPSLLNQRIGVLKSGSSTKLFDRYFYHYLNVLKSEILRNAGGAAQPNISTKTIGKFLIPLPPLPTQQKIAAILDAADAFRQKTKAIIEKYEMLAQSLFLEMFGDPVRNEKGWEMMKLEEVCTKIGSGATPNGGKESYQEEGISLIRSMNVYDNEFKYKDLAFLNELQADKLKNVIVEEDDVLFNITGASVCRSCIVPTGILPARVNQHVSILRTPKDILLPIFLNKVLISESSKKQLLGIGKQGGATREAITKEQLEKYEVIVPPISLQTLFADRIALIETQKHQAQASLAKAEALFNSLLQRAFKGELVS